MPSATEHCRTVLAGIIPTRPDLMDQALRQLTVSHFPDMVLGNLFTMVERYAEVTGSVITRGALADLLVTLRADVGTTALYEETYDLLAATDVDAASFRWSLEQVRELAAGRATGAALTTGMQILTQGIEDDKGEEIRGHAAARSHVLAKFADIDRDLSTLDAPEGDVATEANEMLADYAERKAARLSGHSVGIEFGIPVLDAKIDGINPGELVLIAGSVNEGKTQLVVQLGWNAAVHQHKNVVILTTETVRNQIRRRLVARHSCEEAFGLREGLNSRDIKNGTLDVASEGVLRHVISDLTTNPGYGHIYLVQVPRAATVSYMEAKLTRISRMFPVDLVLMDYLALLTAERRRTTVREELASILRDAKQLATTFNGGTGVPLVSPWQVSRTARVDAERTNGFTPASLSETAEAPNSADLIISLLAPLDNVSRCVTVKMQVPKNRDGERSNAIDVTLDYATSRFGGPQITPQGQLDDLFTGIFGPSPV